MVDVDEARGIKLFGATISVLQVRPAKEEKNKGDQTKLDQKKPDKIIPCPRCKSMETKFCYFNNYNVNQPRHFCKGCQRYWTAGGALRNVPVGAGRRKAKPPCQGFSESCFIDASEVKQIEYDGVVEEEWRWAAARGQFHHVFAAKRRRSTLGGQSC